MGLIVAPHVQTLLNADCSEPLILEGAGARVVMYARPCPDKPVNEDCLAAIAMAPGQWVFVLADGVGGAARGADASRLAVEALVQRLSTHQLVPSNGNSSGQSENNSLRPLILDAFEAAHQQVMELAVGAACTMVVAEVFDGVCRIYHAGDSGCLLVGQRGRLKHRTVFHSPVGYAEEAGLMSERQAITHEQRHIVSNVVGAPDMSVQISSPIQLARFDTLAIASDGLFDNALTKEITTDIKSGPLTKSAARLIERVQSRMDQPETEKIGKPDDLSLILFRQSPTRPIDE